MGNCMVFRVAIQLYSSHRLCNFPCYVGDERLTTVVKQSYIERQFHSGSSLQVFFLVGRNSYCFRKVVMVGRHISCEEIIGPQPVATSQEDLIFSRMRHFLNCQISEW